MGTARTKSVSVASANGSKADSRRDSGEKLNSDKATRIVEAMRKCVANYGAAGATFDHVSREAGVSRGLLHYYFGTKDRLMVEVVRRESEQMVSMIELASEVAESAEQLVGLLFVQLHEVLKQQPEIFLLAFELVGEARREPSIAAEVAEHSRFTRRQFAEMLESLHERGTISLCHDATSTAGTLLAMTSGLAFEILQDPDGDHQPTINANVDAALCLLGAK